MKEIHVIGIDVRKGDRFSKADTMKLMELITAHAKQGDHVCIPFEGSWSLLSIRADTSESSCLENITSCLVGIVAQSNTLLDCISYVEKHKSRYTDTKNAKVKITSHPHQVDH